MKNLRKNCNFIIISFYYILMNKIFLNYVIHILILFFVILIFMYLINIKEKFYSIEAPKILKITKNKSSVYVEWENTNKKINTFIILYININDKNQAVWITNPIKCNRKKCKMTLNNLYGKKYYLTVLSKINDRTSPIEDIIYFSDDTNYQLNDLKLKNTSIFKPTSPLKNNNIDNNKNNIKSNENENENENNIKSNENDIVSNENNIKSNENKYDKNSPSIEPHFNCNKKLKRVNIKTKEDLDSAELKNNCNEDNDIREISELVNNEKRVYDNLWEKLF